MGNQAIGSARWRVLLIVVVVFGALAAFLWLRTKQLANLQSGFRDDQASHFPLESPAPVPTSPTPSPVSTGTPASSPTPTLNSGTGSAATPTPETSPTVNPVPLANSFVGTLKLIIPVAGIRPSQLLDTFTDARSEGRVHDAIDIPAPAGTPVMAAADGEIVKLFQSEQGGTTIYQLSADRKLVFYYAHLQRYADGLVAGKFVKQGEVIAYVGDTGNAGAGNFHLHFSISIIADPKRYWEGTNINPYPLLRN